MVSIAIIFPTAVTRSVPNHVFAWTHGLIRLRQGGMGLSFSGTSGTLCQMFRKKTKKVPRCHRRNTPLSKANDPFEHAPCNSCYRVITGLLPLSYLWPVQDVLS